MYKKTPETLFVCMPQTSHHGDFRGTADEVTDILHVLPKEMPKRFLINPSILEIEPQLQTCQMVHFTCHRLRIPVAPFLLSVLLLDDW